MADGLNQCTLLGNLGADPELRFTQGGQAVLHIRLATSESYLDKDKVRRERTDWHNVTVWGKRGEGLAKVLVKGSTIFVQGPLRTSSYDNREGQKVYKTEINAVKVILCGGKRAGGGGGGYAGEEGQGPPETDDDHRGGGGAPARGSPPGPRPDPAIPPADDFEQGGGYGGDDDIPF